MWIIENLNFTQGGIVEWNNPFYLRHFTMNNYLAIEKNFLGS